MTTSNVPLMFQPLIKYVDFNGRARRSEFWLWVLFRILVGMACGVLVTAMLFTGVDWSHPEGQAFPGQFMSRYFMAMPVIQLVNLGLLLPTIAVSVRRLHDIGRTGWWLVMPIVVAFVCVIVMFVLIGTQIFSIVGHEQTMSEAEGAKFALQMVGGIFLCMIPVLIAEIVMLVFYVTEGERRTNRFGPDPKGEALNSTP